MGRCRARLMRREDIDEVYVVESSSFSRPYPRWYLELLYGLSLGFSLVAVCDSSIVGFAVAVPYLEHRLLHLADLAVAPEWRGRGIGSMLLSQLENIALEAGIVAVFLETWVSNIEARRFYERRGYRPLRVIPGYYEWGEAAVLYVKLLG